jgi:hypothetical protein
MRKTLPDEGVPGFELYLKGGEGGGMRIDKAREIFFDNSFKKYFGEKGKVAFEGLRKTPFFLLLSFRKL